ncbi:MAG: peptide ABC transporter substrate-binding protein [Firmicutes bacterium]|nr:peptide ABC transporter substrate-binding protein [Bacillota bacterium]
MKPRIALVGAMAVGMAVIAAGCGSNSSNQGSGTGSATPQSGGTIVYALPPQTNLNWYMPLVDGQYDSLYNFQLIYSLYKPLIWINNKYQIDWSSSIADKITYNSSGTVYHVFLNPKWHWSNGQPVTSQDVLFTWNVIKAASAPNAPSPWPYVAAGTGDIPNGVQSIVANSAHELTVTLTQPANQQWFEYNGLAQLTPMPAVWNKYPTNMTQELKYLGANGTNPNFDTVVDGPFKLQSATANQNWVMVPNKAYSGHKAYASRFIFTYEGSNSAEFAALKTNTVQVGYLDLAEYGAKAELTNDVVRPGYPFDYQDVELNLSKNAPNGLGQAFSQLYVRQALEMGIDQNATDTAIYHGFAAPQYGPIPVQPKTQFLDPRLTKPLYPYNPAQGKKLLEQNGWHEVNGVMTKNGVKLQFTLMYASGSASTDSQMALLQQDWAKEGVKVTLKPIPFASLIGIIDTPSDANQWAAAGGQGIIYGGSYPTGGQLFGATGGLNNFGYNDATENSLIAATHKPAASTAQSLKTFDQYEYYTAHNLPVLWVNNVATLGVNAKTVHNSYKYGNPLTGYPQFQYFWISQ